LFTSEFWSKCWQIIFDITSLCDVGILAIKKLCVCTCLVQVELEYIVVA